MDRLSSGRLTYLPFMAFKPKGLVSFEDLKTAIIANSQTIAIGDAVIPAATTSAGFVTGAANTTAGVLGVVISIMGANGQVLEKSTVTVASNNQTVGFIAVQYIPTYVSMEFTVDLSAVSGTTTGSNLVGMFNLSASVNGQLNEASYTVYSTKGQFLSYGVNPLNASQVIGHWSPLTAVI